MVVQVDKNLIEKGCNEAFTRYDELIDIRPLMFKSTIEENAKYADIVCRTYGHDEDFVEQQAKSIEQAIYPLNATAVGGAAYFALNAPTEDLRNRWRVFYDQVMRDDERRSQRTKF